MGHISTAVRGRKESGQKTKTLKIYVIYCKILSHVRLVGWACSPYYRVIQLYLCLKMKFKNTHKKNTSPKCEHNITILYKHNYVFLIFK